jgi:hypothetical protein
LSSTILYLAIVAIWAGVLVPRWLRREPHHETSARDASSSETSSPSRQAARLADPEAADTEIEGDGAVGAGGARVRARSQDDERPQRVTGSGGANHVRARAMAARRRLFGILVAAAFAAVTIVAAGLATWWVIVPPALMLAGYVRLLREAARADAELRHARSAAATGSGAHRPVGATVGSSVGGAAAYPVADAGVEPMAGPVAVGEDAGTAEVVDITSRVNEELYDQYADAKLRAVGD